MTDPRDEAHIRFFGGPLDGQERTVGWLTHSVFLEGHDDPRPSQRRSMVPAGVTVYRLRMAWIEDGKVRAEYELQGMRR